MKKMILALTLVIMLAFSGLAFAGDKINVADVNSSADAGAGAYLNNTEVQQYLNAPTIFPNIIPMLQGGKVGDVTGLMPKFAIGGLTPLKKDVYDKEGRLVQQGERVKKVLGVYQGWAFNRIRLDEIETALIAKVTDLKGDKANAAKIRFLVQYKDSVTSSGIGGGAAGSLSGALGDNGAAGTLAILPGIHRSTSDPMYILKFFEVE